MFPALPIIAFALDRCLGIADVHRADAGGEMGQTAARFIPVLLKDHFFW